jgi:hypothetical protein
MEFSFIRESLETNGLKKGAAGAIGNKLPG